jgi:uncharacterized RDD family membrane protein YckC
MKHKTKKKIANKKITYTSDTSSSRIISFIIDWLLGGICAGLPSVILYLLLTGKSKPLTSMYQFGAAGVSGSITILISLVCIIFGVFYYVWIPWKLYPGQTIGKKMTHLKIINQDGSAPTINTYLMRQFVFLVFVEGVSTPVSTYIKVIITTATKFYSDPYLGVFWDLVTIISVFMLFWGKKRLSIHDIATKTMVIKVPSN